MARTTANSGQSGASRSASIPSVSVPRSSFNRTHTHKTTFDGAFLIPIVVDELLPGETYKCGVDSFVRMLTPITPVMDSMYLDTFFFFVPNRLLWDNWKRFMGEEPNPGDSTDFLVPTVDFSGLPGGEFDESTIFDYMGLPPFVDFSNTDVNALHMRAYNLIYNEWFRPEDIIDAVPVHTDDGPDPAADYTLLRRAKRHDYFTAALPFAQKGPAVALPLGSTAPVVTNSQTPLIGNTGQPTLDSPAFTNTFTFGLSVAAAGVNAPALWGSETGMQTDLSAAVGNTINAMRESVTLQQFYERQARGGTRYTEQITSFFGVRSPDARLQRPEYLGGSSNRLNVHPVATTAARTGTADNPVGELTGFVTGGGSGGSFTYSSTEHGVILGLAMVRADLTYQQGISRMWSRQTRFDFAWPIFASLGEQEVLNKEIYAYGIPEIDDGVFGYQERYADYRYAQNRISGLFRSEVADSLDVWHLAQDFANLPTLNEAFLEEDPPFLRVVATQDENIFKGEFAFHVTHVRPLPIYSVPGLARF